MMDHPKNRFAEKISRNTDSFTPSDRMIADYLLRVYPLGLLQNAAEIAEELKITASTVTRFFPKIGYDNIKEARADFREDIRFLINSPMDRVHAHSSQADKDDVFSKTLEQDLANIQDTMRSVGTKTVELFFELFDDPRRVVYVLGTRKEVSLAHYFSYQIASFRHDTRRIEPSNLVDQLANLQPDDVLVVFDFRRYSRNHLKACQYARDVGARVVVFADSPIVPTGTWADCLFLVNTSGLSAFDSYTAGISLINALLTIMVERKEAALAAKYDRLELLYKRFDTFIYQNSDGAQNSSREENDG